MKLTPEQFRKDALVLSTILYNDACMALDDDWDRSDDGFQAQVDVIEIFWANSGYTQAEVDEALDRTKVSKT